MVLYLSVLLHEASHAVMAHRYGFPVSSITLHFLGGMTAIDGEARKPRQEFMIAVVGPLTSLLVGGAAFALWFVTPDGLLLMAVEGLAGANLLVGALNLIPGLPLDGGRVLKVAGVGGHRQRAPRHHRRRLGRAAHRGRGPLLAAGPGAGDRHRSGHPRLRAGVRRGGVPLVRGHRSHGLGPAAPQLPHLVARDLARRTLAVPDDLPLAEAVRRAQEAEAGSIVTVTGSGHPVGVVNEAALVATPEDRRPWVAVSTVARTLDEGLSLPATISGEDLILAISRNPAAEYLLVEEDGTIYGVLSTADVDQAFRTARH